MLRVHVKFLHLNEKLGREKREKNQLFCKLNIKDFTQLYIYNYNKNIYKLIKKTLNEKKCIHPFSKETPLHAGLGSKQRNFQQLPTNLSERNVFAV